MPSPPESPKTSPTPSLSLDIPIVAPPPEPQNDGGLYSPHDDSLKSAASSVSRNAYFVNPPPPIDEKIAYG